jgi:hypothetical protein
MWKPTEQEKQLLRNCASADRNVAYAAQTDVAKALELPLRQGIQPGDIVGDIFEKIPADGLSTMEFPLHFVTPGTEAEMAAFTMPSFGAIPQKHVQGSYVNVPLYYIANSVDWDIRYSRNARWDVVSEAANVLQKGFVKKRNDDGWHTIMGAAYNRGITVADSDATAGLMSVRVISLAKVLMARNGGGNSSSVDNFKLTDLYVSIESEADMRSWKVDQVDEITRNQIFTSKDGVLNRIFNINIHALHEAGEGQEFNTYMTALGATLPTVSSVQRLEWAFGLDLSRQRSFVNPIGEELTVVPDDSQRRSMQTGLFGTESLGWAVLDGRAVMAIAI